jgi:hypothetical protein
MFQLFCFMSAYIYADIHKYVHLVCMYICVNLRVVMNKCLSLTCILLGCT